MHDMTTEELLRISKQKSMQSLRDQGIDVPPFEECRGCGEIKRVCRCRRLPLHMIVVGGCFALVILAAWVVL